MKSLKIFILIIIAALLYLSSSPIEAYSFQQAVNKSTNEVFKDLTFRNIGPSRGGRSTTVTGIADKPATFYMGTTGGGLWKTVDNGINWRNVTDGYIATGSIGAVQVADSNSDIVYVGTGSDGIRSNVIKGTGVYKSTDGSKTWKYVGLENVGQIGAVEINPNDPNIVFVAAIGHAFGPNKERGLYRTTDGSTLR